MGASQRALGLLLCMLVLGGCGDDKKPSAAPAGNGGSGSGGNTRDDDDAGPLDDAGASDAGDAGDAGLGPTPGVECELEGDAPLSFVARRAPDGASFSLSLQGNTVHLVVANTACGTKGQSLDYVSFATTGEPAAVKKLVNSDPGNDCWFAREPAVLTTDDQAWLYFSANYQNGESYPSLELHRKNLLTSDSPERLSMDTDNQVLLSGALLNKGDLPFFVYANDSSTSLDATPVTMGSRRVGKIESILLTVKDGFHPSQTAVGAYGREGQKSLGVVAWLNDLEPEAGVYLRTTDEEGKAVGEIVELTRDIETETLGGAGNVDLAGQTVGGAVAYTVKPGNFQEVRFRAIDESGKLGERVNLTRGQQNVRDVSIAPYAKGYVVAYRRVGGQAGVMGSLELIFVDDAGRVGGSRSVGEATSDGRGLTVRVANDGRIVLVWQDTDGEGAKVRAARLKCSN